MKEILNSSTNFSVFTQYVWISVIIYRTPIGCHFLSAVWRRSYCHTQSLWVNQWISVTDKSLITRLLRGLPQKKLEYSVVARELFIQQSASYAGWMGLLFSRSITVQILVKIKATGRLQMYRAISGLRAVNFIGYQLLGYLPTVSATQCRVEWSVAIQYRIKGTSSLGKI